MLPLLLLVFAAALQSAPIFREPFSYDRAAPLEIHENRVEKREGLKIRDISYNSPGGGRVPAYLVVPEGKGPFAAILWGHWMMRGSKYRNRSEFLDEAVVLARAGVVSLMIDTVGIRPECENCEHSTPFDAGAAALVQRQVQDFRRGVDLLTARGDVDAKRIAFVGHSYNAAVGAILAGVEKRISVFVLMAGVLSNRVAGQADEPFVVKWRQELGEAKLRALMDANQWIDPGEFLPHAAPAPVLIQAAKVDRLAGEKYARRYYALASKPKKLEIYKATHALNAEARRDRVEWLQKQLRLGKIDRRQLSAVPQTE